MLIPSMYVLYMLYMYVCSVVVSWAPSLPVEREGKEEALPPVVSQVTKSGPVIKRARSDFKIVPPSESSDIIVPPSESSHTKSSVTSGIVAPFPKSLSEIAPIPEISDAMINKMKCLAESVHASTSADRHQELFVHALRILTEHGSLVNTSVAHLKEAVKRLLYPFFHIRINHGLPATGYLLMWTSFRATSAKCHGRMR
jgi:hypothetical protein